MVKLARDKFYVLDGAMGTEIQKKNLPESDFFYKETNCEGFNDVLCLTKPSVIFDIHSSYIDAGSNIIETKIFR